MNKLEYYIKIGSIAKQIDGIIKKAQSGKPVLTIGMPESFTPQDLIAFQWERIHILEVATRCTEDQILQWIEAAKKRLDGTEINDFKVNAEVELLKLAIT